jgi:hypothetical protein
MRFPCSSPHISSSGAHGRLAGTRALKRDAGHRFTEAARTLPQSRRSRIRRVLCSCTVLRYLRLTRNHSLRVTVRCITRIAYNLPEASLTRITTSTRDPTGHVGPPRATTSSQLEPDDSCLGTTFQLSVPRENEARSTISPRGTAPEFGTRRRIAISRVSGAVLGMKSRLRKTSSRSALPSTMISLPGNGSLTTTIGFGVMLLPRHEINAARTEKARRLGRKRAQISQFDNTMPPSAARDSA